MEVFQREVLELKQRLNQQQEYCSKHHVYDATSPLMTADEIVQAPASAAESAALGIVDIATQVWKNRFTGP
jgi:alkylhydroperoxidase/carboxymuconolactone decarboxylase family protein YurZ